MIVKKVSLSELEILETWGKVNREEFEQDLSWIETLNSENQEFPTRTEA